MPPVKVGGVELRYGPVWENQKIADANWRRHGVYDDRWFLRYYWLSCRNCSERCQSAQTVTASAYDPISPITSVMPQMQPVLPLALAPTSEIMQAGAYTPPAQNQ